MATTGPEHQPPQTPTDVPDDAPFRTLYSTPQVTRDAETLHDPDPDPGSDPGSDEALRGTLLSRWTALLVSARGGEPEPDPAPFGHHLLDRWSEPQRRYHTPRHLLDVLNRMDELAPHVPHAPPGSGAAHPEPDPRLDLDTVLLAAWFHDAVYRPDRSENEERSAHLAERALPEAGVSRARTAEVARLVRLTVTHDPAPGDTNGEILCDADLSVLAGSPEAYAHYAAQIRQEYGFVPHDDFRDGRASVLRQLLALPRLFRTDYGHEHWERIARRNLTTELELLTA